MLNKHFQLGNGIRQMSFQTQQITYTCFIRLEIQTTSENLNVRGISLFILLMQIKQSEG